MINQKRVQQLAGESIREMGILMFVFAPLDAFLAEMAADHLMSLVLLFAASLIVVGIMIESTE